MPAEARIAPIWKKQKLFVALFFLGFGAWFWWDGLIGYPRSNERWSAYEQHRKDGQMSDWPAYAKERGWKEEPPHKAYTGQDIVGQFVFGGLCDIFGVILLAYWAGQIRRTLKSDDSAVYTPSGTRVPFEAITGIGKKHWDAKGIAKVRYTMDGRQRQFVVDDYKFETEPARQILKEIEDRLLSRQSSTESVQ